MAFSLLGIVNALSPKDAGSRRVAHDVPYGHLPRRELDIYAPRQAGGLLPVVVFVYGGSWMDGDRRHYEFAGRALAALGYVTVIADYRLLPEVEYPGFLDDCAAALGWVADHIEAHGGDGHRIGLMGHSAGAYNAAMLALHPAYLADAGLRGRVRCLVGLSGPYDFYPFDGPISLRTFGAVRDPGATQPVNHVSASARPAFLGHGGKDRLVLPRNSTELARRLRAAGVAVEERHYAGLGHPATLLALGRPARAIAPVLADVAQFLSRYLAPPVPDLAEATASAYPAGGAPR